MSKEKTSDALTRQSVVAMLAFSACSSSLLLVNKLCVHRVPCPSLISSIQFAVSVVTIFVLKAAGVITVDPIVWSKVRPYTGYVVMFVCTIYANMKSLEHSNVETLIVFRACSPFIVSLLDWAFLGRHLPGARSFLALAMLGAGAAG